VRHRNRFRQKGDPQTSCTLKRHVRPVYSFHKQHFIQLNGNYSRIKAWLLEGATPVHTVPQRGPGMRRIRKSGLFSSPFKENCAKGRMAPYFLVWHEL